MTLATYYPDFAYEAGQLLKFLAVDDHFTIMLKDGDIIHFTPNDSTTFKKWLEKNGVQNLRKEDGWIVGNRR